MNKLILGSLVAVLSMAVGCTKSPEKEVITALNEQYGTKKIETQIKTESDKLFGPKSTKFKDSVTSYITKNTKVTFAEAKVTENTATVKFNAEQPDGDYVGGLVLLMAFADPKKVEGMTMEEFIEEANKGSKKRKAASVNDIKIKKYEGTLNLVKENEKWVLAEKQGDFFAKKYLVK